MANSDSNRRVQTIAPRVLAHAVRNAIYPLRLYPDLLSLNLKNPAKMEEILGKWIQVSEHVFSDIDDFVLIAEAATLEKMPCNMTEIVASVLAARDAQKGSASVNWSSQHSPEVMVNGNSQAFRRMLHHLLNYACMVCRTSAPDSEIDVRTKSMPLEAGSSSWGLEIVVRGVKETDAVFHWINSDPLSADANRGSMLGIGMLLTEAVLLAFSGSWCAHQAEEGISIELTFPCLPVVEVGAPV